MAAGLVASYGTFAAIAARYLYPPRPTRTRWIFVTDVAGMQVGESRSFRTPSGAMAAIARRAAAGAVDDFIALSSTCPHLGCQVHWEAKEGRFLCPCHQGVFDRDGNAIAGPPAAAGQSLARASLTVDPVSGTVFLEA